MTISRTLKLEWLNRYNELNIDELKNVVYDYGKNRSIDANVVESILKNYMGQR
jgi:hypothetical protein